MSDQHYELSKHDLYFGNNIVFNMYKNIVLITLVVHKSHKYCIGLNVHYLKKDFNVNFLWCEYFFKTNLAEIP